MPVPEAWREASPEDAFGWLQLRGDGRVHTLPLQPGARAGQG